MTHDIPLLQRDMYRDLINLLAETLAPHTANLDQDKLSDVLEYTIAASLSNTYSVQRLRDRDLISKATKTLFRRFKAFFGGDDLLDRQFGHMLTEADFRGRVVVITDETPLQKYGEEIFAAGPIHDTRVQRTIHGIHIVTVIVMIGELKLTYRCAIYQPEDECKDQDEVFKTK